MARTTQKQRDDQAIKFYKVLVNNNFNVMASCNEMGISRSVYYEHIKDVMVFKKEMLASNAILFAAFTEGVTHPDLNVRAKYLSLIPPRVLVEALGINDTTADEIMDAEGTVTFS